MDGLAARILDALGDEGPLTTEELADRLDAGRDSVRRECRELEETGDVVSTRRRSTRRLLFFPMTREVVHGANYDRVTTLDGDLIAVVMGHGLPAQRAALRRALRSHFAELAERDDLDPYRNALDDFEARLLAAVDAATETQQVKRELGTRPFYPQLIVWDLP